MKKYISIILTILYILSLVACNGKGNATREMLLSMDEFWKSVTEVVYYDFNEDVYQASDITQLEEIQTIFENLTYKEIENPWLEGWYMFEIHANQNTYHLSVSGKTISFDEKFYEVSDSISEELLKIMKSESNAEDQDVVGGDLIPMVMINGEIYMDTGHESTVEARCGVMDGEITSTVDGSQKPTKDNESNFGTGYGYQYGTQEGLIEIYMNDKWCVFATEKALASSQMMVDPVIPVTIKNIFTGEEASLTVNEDIRVISDILSSDTWNSDATADCLNNIEITFHGETYMYHSDCGTFNDNLNQRYMTLDDSTTEKLDEMIEKYVSLTAADVPVE